MENCYNSSFFVLKSIISNTTVLQSLITWMIKRISPEMIKNNAILIIIINNANDPFWNLLHGTSSSQHVDAVSFKDL